MFEDACALSGRNGARDASSAEPTDELPHAQLITDGPNGAMVADVEIPGGDAPHVPSTVAVGASHTAAPELTHPGESQSNGLAERSVGIFEDQFRTLKCALEQRIKMRIPSKHPVMSWLVEHTACVLNKYALDAHGKTAYGRLHGREGIEKICEFSERVMWLVPKKLRAKLDQRWRCGVFLGRPLSSDQNMIGLINGDVVCARAIIRVVTNIRWSSDRVSKVRATPMTFNSSSQDHIEEKAEPHSHVDPTAETEDHARNSRRVPLYDADVQTHGYTEGCPRCEYLRQGLSHSARGVRHNETCREHTYDALRTAGARKMRDADATDSARTRARTRQVREDVHPEPVDAPTVVDDAPTGRLPDPMDDGRATPVGPSQGHMNDDDDAMHEPDDSNVDNTFDFHHVVDDDIGDYMGVEWNGDELHDPSDSHMLSSLVDALQTLGVPAADVVAYSVAAVKDHAPSMTTFGTTYNPTFVEVYGQGNIVKASHGCRRNINLHGLDAFDLRTAKPSGEAWDFTQAADRRLARTIVEDEKPTWLVGSPPCTFFSAWNQGLNHKKMDPSKVEELRVVAMQHLHFVVGLYRLQVEPGRHFLHEHPAGATSWQDPWFERLMMHPKISSLLSDQCEYGLLTPDADGLPTPARKPTRWMSSSSHMLKRLSRRCQGQHTHQNLVGGRAKAAEDYSIELITEILRGMRDTADHEEECGDAPEAELEQAMITAGLLHDVRYSSLVADYRAEDLKADTKKLQVRFKHRTGRVDPVNLAFKESYKDEYTNEELPMGHVRLARQEELEYFCDNVWVGVPIEEAMADTEGKIIGSRWVNCNKDDMHEPDVRCRLVAQEVNLHADESFYAATPPLEAKTMLFSEFASTVNNGHLPVQLSFVYVKNGQFLWCA